MELPNKASGNMHRYILHMNGNQDQLLAIVKHKVPEPKLPKGDLGQLIILKVTPEGDGLVLVADEPANLPSNWPKDKPFRIIVPFEPPLANANSQWELEERLTALKKEAFAKYEINEYPQVNQYDAPPWLPYLLPLLIAMAVQAFCVFAPAALGGDKVRSWIARTLGIYALDASVIVLIVSHILEVIYMNGQCSKHRTPFAVRAKYCLGTLCVGVAVMSAFSEKVLQHKINQVYQRSSVSDETRKSR